MTCIRRTIDRVALGDLIAIHALSHRKDSLFVSFNSGGFTEELISSELFGHEKGAFTGTSTAQIGLIESGAGGTVFLDEIGEMPHSMQVKLLHVIQEKRIFRVGGIRPIDLDIRIAAATNRDLKKEVETGNIRELKNIIERAIAQTDQNRIQVTDLSPDLQKLDFKTFETLEMETLEEMEKRYITTILQRTTTAIWPPKSWAFPAQRYGEGSRNTVLTPNPATTSFPEMLPGSLVYCQTEDLSEGKPVHRIKVPPSPLSTSSQSCLNPKLPKYGGGTCLPQFDLILHHKGVLCSHDR